MPHIKFQTPHFLSQILLISRQNKQSFQAFYEKDRADFWQTLLYYSFWLSIALFPISYGFREVMPPLCLIFLLLYYRHAWKESVLANLKPAWLFLCPLAMTLLGIAFSIHPWDSLLHAGTGVNKAFILPFIAMECVKSPSQLFRLAWAFAFACFWEGLDCVYQSLTGTDFFFGYKLHSKRLTGSLGDYTIGNYLSLALIPASAIWFILSARLPKITASFLCFALFLPALYGIQGASTRSGILALAAACFLLLYLLKGLKNIFVWVCPCLIFLLFIITQPGRLDPGRVATDDRWDLWSLAWQIFKAHPWLGAGAGQYNTAFREMGLKPVHEVITISHPHNLYLDILYAHGIIGFLLAAIFLGGFLFWGLRHLLPKLRNSCLSHRLYWIITSFFWLGFAGWMVNGIFAHDFYRIWWLAQAMTSLGILIGAIAWGEARLTRQNAPVTHNPLP